MTTNDAAAEVMAKKIKGMSAIRPRDLAPTGVPVSLRTVFHVHLTRGRFRPSWSPRLVMAKWVLSGQGAMEIGNRRHVMHPGQVAIYLPTIAHRFWAESDSTEFVWFTVDGPLAEQVVMELGLQPGVYTVAPPTAQTIDELSTAIADVSASGQRHASLLALTEWYRIADALRIPEPTTIIAQVRHLIAQEFADPDLSVVHIARRLGYHRSAISRLFHHHTGTTIVQHLSNVRLNEARALLAHSEEPVATIAQLCGFTTAAYFSRWFRQQTSMTPGHFRSSQTGRTVQVKM